MKSKKNTKKVFIAVFVAGLLIFFHYTKISLPLESILQKYTKSIFLKIYSLSSGVRVVYYNQTTKRDLSSENKECQNNVDKLIAENARLRGVEDENKTLSGYLNFFRKNKYNYLMANVVSRSVVGGIQNSQSLIIDRGLKDGLKNGLVVVDLNGIVVGKISKIKEEVAEVELTTNPNCRLAAAISGDNKTSGVAHGDLGLTIKLDFVPQGREMKDGGLVVTSGLEDGIPWGLVLAIYIKFIRRVMSFGKARLLSHRLIRTL